MNIELVVRDDTPAAGGNWQSAARLAHALRNRGAAAEVRRVSEPHRASVVHAFHALASALPLLDQGLDPRRMVVTWTGTDLSALGRVSAEALARLGGVAHHTALTGAAAGALHAAGPAWRVSHIPPGVDARRFRPGPARSAGAPPQLLLAGAGRPVKRPAWAVALVGALRDAGAGAELTVVGPPRDAALWAELGALARTRPWLALVDEVPPEDMPRWYQGADVVLNVSEAEGLSNALLEGMASGLPAVVTDIPGNRALVSHGTTGVVFSDAAEFVGGVEPLLRDPAERLRLGRAARAFVEAHHSLQQEADAFWAVYQRVAG